MSAAFEETMSIRARGMPAPNDVQISGTDPVFSTRFQIGSACANVLAGVGVGVSDIREQKARQRQQASIDVRHAAATLRSSLYLQSKQGSGEFATFRNPSISCFGPGGSFSHRPGWEQIAQTVTGICNEGSPTRPALLPASACDYTIGFLGAYGVLLVLERCAREGGSYQVHVSFCQSGVFIYRHGKVEFDSPGMDLSVAELVALRIHSETGHGPIRHLGPVLKLSKSTPGWSRPTLVLGEHAAHWAM